MSFYIQSAEYSPIYLQAKILEFIDTFYTDIFDRKTFEKYKRGALNRMKAGYSGMLKEAEDLYR